jgi:hypothetical protein
MPTLSSTGKSLLTGLAALFLAFSALGLLFIALVYPFDSPMAYIAGLFGGTAVSAIKVAMLEHSISKAVDMGKDAAPLYYVAMYILRVTLTGAFLALAAISPSASVWGAILGLLSLSISAYGVKLFSRNAINADER